MRSVVFALEVDDRDAGGFGDPDGLSGASGCFAVCGPADEEPRGCLEIAAHDLIDVAGMKRADEGFESRPGRMVARRYGFGGCPCLCQRASGMEIAGRVAPACARQIDLALACGTSFKCAVRTVGMARAQGVTFGGERFCGLAHEVENGLRRRPCAYSGVMMHRAFLSVAMIAPLPSLQLRAPWNWRAAVSARSP